MSLLAATLVGKDHSTHVCTNGQATFSISVECPLPDHMTLAYEDADGQGAMIVSRDTFDKAIAAYLGVAA